MTSTQALGTEENGVVRPSPFGRVAGARGSTIRVSGATPSDLTTHERATVGSFVEVAAGGRRLVGVVTELVKSDDANAEANKTNLTIDLMGEFEIDGAGSSHFVRGVSTYPAIGDAVGLVDRGGLRSIFNQALGDSANVGRLAADGAVGVSLDLDAMLSRHFAIVGSTGVGKSSGVAVIINRLLVARPTLHIFLLDVHNEYGRCFGDKAQVLNGETTRIPFWLFTFEEFVDVLFGGRPPVDEEIDILLELIPLAKAQYNVLRGGNGNLRRIDPKVSGLSVDTPVPYQLQDLLNLIDERMGKLESRATRMHFHHLLGRIEAIRNDARYAFMFESANVGGDTMAEIIAKLFRLECDGPAMTVMQISGFPTEATEALVSVLLRLAFEVGLWSYGAWQLLFVCEEAHRFVSADKSTGFAPTRRGLLRIAKEGRKYGVNLGLVTQRPAELDPTVISQCNTIFAMRLPNERDQKMLRSAVSDAVGDLHSFLPSLGTREVIGFGDGMPMPARFRFNALSPETIPMSEAYAPDSDRKAEGDRASLRAVIERWRGGQVSQRTDYPAEAAPESASQTPPPAPTSITSRIEQVRAQLLKR